MKRILFLITIGFIFSCNKDKDIQLLNQKIIGTWELESYAGYPFIQPTLPPGNGRIIVIGGEGSFERKIHDTLLFKGNYTLQKKMIVTNGKTTSFQPMKVPGTITSILKWWMEG